MRSVDDYRGRLGALLTMRESAKEGASALGLSGSRAVDALNHTYTLLAEECFFQHCPWDPQWVLRQLAWILETPPGDGTFTIDSVTIPHSRYPEVGQAILQTGCSLLLREDAKLPFMRTHALLRFPGSTKNTPGRVVQNSAHGSELRRKFLGKDPARYYPEEIALGTGPKL